MSEPLGELLETDWRQQATGDKKTLPAEARREERSLGVLITYSLSLRLAAPGRGRPVARESAHSGPPLRSGGREVTAGAAGTRACTHADGSCEPGLSSASSAAAQSERGRSSQRRRGPPAPSPQPWRGSDDWDISWKLFSAGGVGKTEEGGIRE